MFLVTAGEICSMVDDDITNFMHSIILVIEVAVPILLIIFGMIDFTKAVIGANEDEIKKGQKVFMKRVIAAIFVFFIISITQFVIGLIPDESSEIWACASAILNGTNKQVNIQTDKDSSSDEDDFSCTGIPNKYAEEGYQECV